MIAPQAKISDRGSTISVGGGAPQPAGGGFSNQGFSPQVARDLWLGLGIAGPHRDALSLLN